MQVYIEYAILDNFCIDFVLLFLMLKVLHIKAKWWQYFLACSLGTAIAICLPLVSLPLYASIPIKILSGVLLSVFVLWRQPFFVWLVGFLLLMVFTFSLAGMTIAFLYLFKHDSAIDFSLNYSGALPVGLLILGVFCVFEAVLFLVKYIRERRIIAPFLRSISLQIDGKILNLSGYMDSGNRLLDPQTGMPVIVVCKQALKMLSKNWWDSLLANKLPKHYKQHFIPINTTSGNGKLIAFKPDWLHIGNFRHEAMVAISNEKFSEVLKVDALFGPDLM